MNPAKTLSKNVRSKIVIDKPLFIAAHFGFTPIDAPRITDADREIVEDCIESTLPSGKLVCDPVEKAAFLRAYNEREMQNWQHPLALSWKESSSSTYSLELVGYPTGIAEAKLIRTALSILSEEGYNNMMVEINSIGDKESIASFERELHTFLRKYAPHLSAETRKTVKDDIFLLVEMENEEIQPFKDSLPSSIATLTAPSRAQFKEVLTFLEALGVDFRFAPELIGNRHFCSETLFTIRDAAGKLLAGGFRYSRLSRRFGLKKELSFIGARVFCQPEVLPKKMYKDLPRPRFYFVHLGHEAKLKALSLIELLRTHHIPLHHLLGKDKFGAQIQAAESSRAPYLLIVGQKEALDDTVTIRNVATRAQDTVSLASLPLYLKHLPF